MCFSGSNKASKSATDTKKKPYGGESSDNSTDRSDRTGSASESREKGAVSSLVSRIGDSIRSSMT